MCMSPTRWIRRNSPNVSKSGNVRSTRSRSMPASCTTIWPSTSSYTTILLLPAIGAVRRMLGSHRPPPPPPTRRPPPHLARMQPADVDVRHRALVFQHEEGQVGDPGLEVVVGAPVARPRGRGGQR